MPERRSARVGTGNKIDPPGGGSRHLIEDIQPPLVPLPYAVPFFYRVGGKVVLGSSPSVDKGDPVLTECDRAFSSSAFLQRPPLPAEEHKKATAAVLRDFAANPVAAARPGRGTNHDPLFRVETQGLGGLGHVATIA